MVLRLRTAGAGARTRAGNAALRDPGRDAAVDPRSRRDRPGRAAWCTRRTGDVPRCTTAPTTTRRSAASPPSTRAWRIRWPTTRSWSCRPPPREPACGSRTARPTSCRSATADAVRDAWRLHLDLVRRSLERGYYQGWDLHPAQLPTRYAATFGFYRDGLAARPDGCGTTSSRPVRAILDEPATARALADYILRAVHCGASTRNRAAGVDRPGARSDLADLARPGR